MGRDLSKEEVNGSFSLVAGGPLYRIWRRAHLLRPPLDLLVFRTAVISGLAWLPLLPLSLFSGYALRGVAVPFFFDLDAHARFLVALPLLIIGELFVHERIPLIVRQFIDRNLVVPEDQGRFQRILDSTLRLRNSILSELVMIVVVWTLGHWIWEKHTSLTVATWFASREDSGTIHYTPAGYWYAYASIPIFQFLLLRWAYRLVIWYRFLWKISRLHLKLVPTHPDRAGGIGVLAASAYAFGRVLMAHTILFAGMIGNRIWHASASLLDFKLEIVALIVLLLALVFAPLTFFSTQLMKAKRAGLLEYGILSEQYTRGFDAKWIRGQPPSGEHLVGSSDIQSLADMDHSYQVIQEMRPVPFSKESVIRLGALLALPFLPLTLTIIPVDKILDKLVGILL